MNKEKILNFLINYVYSTLISFILCMTVFSKGITLKESILVSLIFSLILGWLLVGTLGLHIIKEIIKDIKNKNYKNIIIWIVICLILFPYFLNKIFI